jgi:hypothetical protein
VKVVAGDVVLVELAIHLSGESSAADDSTLRRAPTDRRRAPRRR